MGDLFATLDQFSVPSAEQNELLGILGPLRGDIVSVESDATGTPLTAVGEVVTGPGTRWLDGRGRAVTVAPGFEHFRG